MNRYNFVKRSAPSATDLNSATSVTDVAEILSASALISEYKFEKSEELSSVFSKAEAVETEIATRGNGSDCNRVRVTLQNGKAFLCRAYGLKNSVAPPHKWGATEIEKISAGFCKSDGERIEELRQSPNGDILNVPVIYVKIA